MTIRTLYDNVMAKYGELIRYGIFGVLTTLISWGTYSIFVWMGIEWNISNILSWICGVAFAFVTNKWLVFESKSTDKKVLAYETGSFVGARIFTGVIAIALFPVLCNFGMDWEMFGTPALPAKITTSIIEIIINWVLSKYLIFNKNISFRKNVDKDLKTDLKESDAKSQESGEATLHSVSIVLPAKDGDSLMKGLQMIGRQTITDYQLVIVMNDPETNLYLNQNWNMIKTKDRVMKFVECDDSQLIVTGMGLCTGEFVWICDPEDDADGEYLENMLVIQRNLGCDVVITDCRRKEKEQIGKNDTVTLYTDPDKLFLKVKTTYAQWVKFFRRSLLADDSASDIKSMAGNIAANTHSLCHYRKKMLFSGNNEIMTVPEKDTMFSCDYGFADLIGLDGLRSAKKIPITIGICAYNEQYVIERTIRSIFEQKGDTFVIDRVIVVSSGSTDDTNEIVYRLSKEYDVILPVYQEKKEGKNSAINELLRNSRTEIVVLYNADNIMSSEYTLDMLVRPLLNDKVGITGGHPIPLNSSDTITDFTVRMTWMMHHCVSVISPNMGELIAFRNVGITLPTDTQGDEGIIRHTIESKGYDVVYVPQAVLFNKGPTTVREYIKQRMRVNIGERHMLRKMNFEHPTHGKKILAKALLSTMKQMGLHPFQYGTAIFLELLARIKARAYAEENESDMFSWEPIESTKKI